jgi:hypothetical protein
MHDFSNMSIAVEDIPFAKLDTRRQGAKRRDKEGFVMFPLSWRKRLEGARHIATIWLALFILYKSTWSPDEPVIVSNVAIEGWGHLSRESKREGLKELEALGLVSVEQSGKQSPRVKILPCQPKPHSLSTRATCAVNE